MAMFARTTVNKSLFINNYNKLTVYNTRSRTLFGISRNPLTLRRCQRNLRNAIAYSDKKQAANSSKTLKNATKDNEECGTFDQLLAVRRNEANRSIVVQVQSPESYRDLYSYCCDFGPIIGMHHYVISRSTHFFLIEFQDIAAQRALISSATHLNHSEIIPVHSQMLWFRNIAKRTKIIKDVPVMMPSTTENPSNDAVTKALLKKKSITEQMEHLHDICKLDDIGTRLRFITAHQMETSFNNLFPNIAVYPFGSSVNGFGRKGCDLDLVLSLESNKTEKSSSRLVFHTKSAMSEERAQTKRSMETIANVMQTFIPGVKNVRRILHARVPILKYDHIFTGVECDLSMTNMTAVYMSELLYLYGETNAQVRPLIFTIRQWASSVGITNANPGNWITNFSLTLMVLFYLQTKEILPSINTLKQNTRPSDVRLTDTCVDCTFIRDLKYWPLNKTSSTNATLEGLLMDFFLYYSNFDFTTKGMSLRDGMSLYKPDTSPLYICNPLEKTLNVSKNVSLNEVSRFINAVRNAAMLMEEGCDAHQRGLIDIFAEKQPERKQFILGREKKVRIAELFTPEINKIDDTTAFDRWKKERARRR